MKTTDPITTAPPGSHAGQTAVLALRLAAAENALLTLTTGQVDAVIDPTGKTYLLRPAQEHLREKESRLRALLGSIGDVIVVVNRSGVILSQSDAVTRVLGFQADELEGAVLFRLVHDEDLIELHAAFTRIVEGYDERLTACFRHRAGDGSFLMMEAVLAPLRGAGAQNRVVLSLRPATRIPRPAPADLPARRKAVNPVEPAAEPPAGYHFSLPTHEVHLPHATLRFNPADVWQGDESPAGTRERLSAVRRNVELQLQLVEELGNSMAVGPYRVRLHLAAINEPGNVLLLLAICREGGAVATQIEVQFELPAGDPLADADPLELQQVIWALVKNAVAFSARYGSVPAADEAAGPLVAGYDEHGTHVEPELLPLVFQALPQAQEAMERIYGSLRLGLFIAKGLAASRQGALTLAGRGDPGRETIFRLGFQIASPGAA